MLLTPEKKISADRVGAVRAPSTTRRWPTWQSHYKSVHAFRLACERSDIAKLMSLLHPDVAVVVDAGDEEQSRIRMVRGTADAASLLIHGMARETGISIQERSVNGQAGLILTRDGVVTTVVSIDITARLISAVWIVLHPTPLRHWNMT